MQLFCMPWRGNGLNPTHAIYELFRTGGRTAGRGGVLMLGGDEGEIFGCLVLLHFVEIYNFGLPLLA